MSNGPGNGSQSGASSSSSSDDDHEVEVQQPIKKKKRTDIEREFTEVDRWDLSDHSDEEILVFIRKNLDGLNRPAGILQAVPSAHKTRTNIYSDFQFRRK